MRWIFTRSFDNNHWCCCFFLIKGRYFTSNIKLFFKAFNQSLMYVSTIRWFDIETKTVINSMWENSSCLHTELRVTLFSFNLNFFSRLIDVLPVKLPTFTVMNVIFWLIFKDLCWIQCMTSFFFLFLRLMIDDWSTLNDFFIRSLFFHHYNLIGVLT